MFRKLFISFLAALTLFLACPKQADCQSRVFNAPRKCTRLLAKQFAAGANVFTLVDPSPSGTPLTRTSATGISGIDGQVNLSFATASFTAPITLTIFVWQQDIFNPANACWVRVASVAAGYQGTVDHTYAVSTFTVSESTEFIVMTSGAVTGNVYTDAKASSFNNNSVAGYQ